jgi:ABC-type lipoprotein export system ATPase subunit
LFNDQFRGDWDSYLRRIDDAVPRIEALGVTDYFGIRTYREVCRFKEQGRLPGVALIFPNVEMRLDIKTDKARAINLHLLFSPDDPKHEAEIERALSHLTCEFRDEVWRCVEADLVRIGRLVAPDQQNELALLRAGAQQFKIDRTQLRNLFRRSEWIRKNCLVAVAGGLGDGTAGLQKDDSYRMTREDIEGFAHIIFSSTPSQREFWLGKGVLSVAQIEHTYGGLKPCLHGSDAHASDRVAAPGQDRFTWLKGDPIFETLRQAVLAPGERAWIGPEAPTRGASARTIDTVRVNDAPWLATERIELNPGLVAIIGERGSGKTALVEIIARGARATGDSEQSTASFLRRATDPVDLIGDATVQLDWSDGTRSTSAIRPEVQEPDPWEIEPEGVRYLSQQFVDLLCSATGLATQLRAAIEKVIFDSTPRGERIDTTSFAELAEVSLEPILRRRNDLSDAIVAAGDTIEVEDGIKARLPAATKERGEFAARLVRYRADLATLLPSGKDDRTRRLLELEAACAFAESRIEGYRKQLQRIEDLETEVKHVHATTEPARFRQMKARFAATGLTDDDWAQFGMNFVGDVPDVIKRARDAIERAIAVVNGGDPDQPVDMKMAPVASWPLVELKRVRDEMKQVVGIDAQKQIKYNGLNRAIGDLESAIRRLDEEIAHGQRADTRREGARQDRRRAYADVFSTFKQEEDVLAALYQPLRAHLGSAEGSIAKLAFTVERQVDLAAWVDKGEQLVDLRTKTEFRGRGGLATLATERLLPAWRTGSAEAVATAMDAFLESIREGLKHARPPSADGRAVDRAEWGRQVARWMYSTDHVSIRYAITYDGVRVEQLSPGTRGIVLLLLYLVLDQQDHRPLIIDQPEENLDPKSVFDELVPHFREAKRRRQVIVVTHNANLVVNTDADQVLVATAKHEAPGRLPTIDFMVGSLENRETRSAVCATLEGGERAFLEREKRYRLRLGDLSGDVAVEISGPVVEPDTNV